MPTRIYFGTYNTQESLATQEFSTGILFRTRKELTDLFDNIFSQWN